MTIACYALMTTALLLAVFLLATVTGGFAQRADAGQITADGNGILLTARSDSDNETLFVLDAAQDRIVILHSDVERGRLEVLQTLELRTLFVRR